MRSTSKTPSPPQNTSCASYEFALETTDPTAVHDLENVDTGWMGAVYGAGDVDRNGQVDASDPQTLSDFNTYGTGDLVVDPDINRDGVVDFADDALVQDQSDRGIWSQGRGFPSNSWTTPRAHFGGEEAR